MKKIIFMALLALIFTNVSAQQTTDLAMRTNDNKTDNLDINSSGTSNNSAKYTLESYGGNTNTQSVFEDEHFLGGTTTIKWNQFLKNYKRVYEQTVGLSGSTVEIIKPTVFNAVNKINNYYKKIYKNEALNREAITLSLNHILDCANLLCYESDIKKIEQEIKNAKDTKEILLVFDSIKIIYHQ